MGKLYLWGKTLVRTFLAFLLIPGYLALSAQDTLRIMHYNLLNYGNNYGDCNSTNNNVDDKNDYLRTIVGYLEPDILTVNEMDNNEYYHGYLLDEVFNTAGTDLFIRASLPNLANSPIMNQVYFNSGRFTLVSTETVETNYRDIDLVTLQYTGDGTQEPVGLLLAVAHLKAGSDPEDAQERASETYRLMDYLDDNDLDGNMLLAGDLNLYSGSESAFQNLLLYPDADLRFHDPVNKVGEWHANAFFSDVHTQSTHLEGGCPSGGGMDDRFDFILASGEIMQGTDGITYVPGSYTAVGQDGQRFDQSLVNPANNTVPGEVLTALFHMSDHLPVIMDLEITDPAGTGRRDAPLGISFPNPASDPIPLTITSDRRSSVTIGIRDPLGNRKTLAREWVHGRRTIHLNAAGLSPGIYILTVGRNDGNPLVRKLVIR